MQLSRGCHDLVNEQMGDPSTPPRFVQPPNHAQVLHFSIATLLSWEVGSSLPFGSLLFVSHMKVDKIFGEYNLAKVVRDVSLAT